MELKLAFTLVFVGNPNMIVVENDNGRRKTICQFDEEGLFITDDAKIATKLDAKKIPFHVYDGDKMGKKIAEKKKKSTNEKVDDDIDPFQD